MQMILLTFPCLFGQKTLEATRVDVAPVIDGDLQDDIWSEGITSGEFIEWQPKFGDQPDKQTEVKIVYDDEAIYISAFLEEISRDSIMTQLAQRDEIGNTDFFGFLVDTYGNGNDALEFIVSATGVQFDAKVTTTNGEDSDWDGVWFSEVDLRDDGWTVEMKIPYAAIRFPKNKVQEWKINFFRFQARKNERSSWFPIDPAGTNFLTQMGDLVGINNIKPPIRLSLSPYVSTYVQHSHDKYRDPVNSTGTSYNGGMDIKYGINDAFTLDMTLIPDFGQVQSDDQILNLSPFEVRFNENRPFFTEGIEIFSKGDLFYSRRVGGTPIGYFNAYANLGEHETITSNPTDAQLYNATKISGRTDSGLGVGIFNAVSGATKAMVRNEETGETREVETGPLSNYNVFVLDKNLANNSFLAFANSNVWRAGDDYYNANVSATEFDLKNKSQTYGVSGSGAVSQLIFPNADNINGYRYEMIASKLTGNFNFDIYHDATSRDFNANDLGFVRRTNFQNYGFSTRYGIYDSWWKFNRGNVWLDISHSRLHEPNRFMANHINTGFWFEAKNFWNYNLWANYRPPSNDFFEPRTDGRFYRMTNYYNTGIWIGSDNRKALRVNGSLFGYNTGDPGRNGYNVNLGLRYRFSDKLSVSFNSSMNEEYRAEGWVGFGDASEIYFGRRDQQTNSNVIYAEYTLNDKMGLDFRLRHYWSKVVYEDFFELDDNGMLMDSEYDEFHDFSFNLFNIDLNYRWRFAPGSDIFINWKNNIAGGQYSDQINYENLGYFRGLRNLSDYEQNNSFSVRVVYFLDYQQIKNKF